MDMQTGKIHQMDESMVAEFKKNMLQSMSVEEGVLRSSKRKMVELTDEQVADCETMGLQQRKGYMRNKPCVCGSGKKFKNCCWSKFK